MVVVQWWWWWWWSSSCGDRYCKDLNLNCCRLAILKCNLGGSCVGASGSDVILVVVVVVIVGIGGGGGGILVAK